MAKQLTDLLCFCSFLEEDPLYIAYADMMAKVSVVFNPILKYLFWLNNNFTTTNKAHCI